MRMPSQASLFSFMCSVILTSSLIPVGGSVNLASAGAPAVQAVVQTMLNGMRVQGFTDSTTLIPPAPIETPPAAPPAADLPPMTGFMGKMLQLISLYGTDREMPGQYASALGLTVNGQTWASRQESANGSNTGFHRGFSVSRGDDQDVVLALLKPDVLLIFRAHRDGTLVAALKVDRPTKALTMRDVAEAQADFAAEWASWVESVDKLLAGG